MTEINDNQIKKIIDENDQLKDQIKALKKRKKYGVVRETREENPSQQEYVVSQCQKELPVLKEVNSKGILTKKDHITHILIEWDNYHALSSLYYTHKNKVDLIYIDPPYNTGNKSRKYNNDYVEKEDEFKHSKRLNMMSVRLKLAKDLLKKDWVLICAIDENEHSTLWLLLSELFNKYNIDCISIVHNPRWVQWNNFSYCHEYAFFVYPNDGKRYIGHKKIQEEDIDRRWLRDNWGESLRTDAKNCFYPIILEWWKIVWFGDVLDFSKHPKWATEVRWKQAYVYPIDRKWIERKRRYARQSVDSVKHLLRAKKTNDWYDIDIGKDFWQHKTVWIDKKYDSNEYWTKLVKQITGVDFPFPKSIHTVKDCISLVVWENKNSVVLDFFAWSGTTGQAVMEMNQEDNWERQFILVTNNEIWYKEECSFKTKYKIDDTTLQQRKMESNKKWIDYIQVYGICSSVTYPRIQNIIKGYKYTGVKKDILFSEILTPSKLNNMSKYLETIEKLQENKSYDDFDLSIKDNNLKLEWLKKISQKMPWIWGNLKYYSTDFVENKSTDRARRQLVLRSVDMLCLVEQTFDPISHTEDYAIYARYDKNLFTVVIFDEGKIKEALEKISKIKDSKIVIYQFTYNDNIDPTPYKKLLSPYQLKAVPDSLLRSYHTVFKKTLKILSNQS